MMQYSYGLLLLLGCIHIASSQIDADLVPHIPYAPRHLPYKVYSGYLATAAEARKLHYVFVTYDGPASDTTPPLIVWLNGGPGCSSMEGLFNENGPLMVSMEGKSPKLTPNDWSWNKLGHVLYIEAPAGVGYSYAVGGNVTTSDEQTAEDNYRAIKDFIKKFPKFTQGDLYVTGESYGGIYVPTLSAKLAKDPLIKIKGMAVGNGLSTYRLNQNSIVYYAYYHGIIGPKTWATLQTHCCSGKTNDHNSCNFYDPKDKICQQTLEHVQAMITNDQNIYNLYSECYHPKDSKFHVSPHSWLFPKDIVSQHLRKSVSVDPPCVNTVAITTYLNLDSVRNALHIPKQLPHWSVCSGPVGAGYQRQYMDMTETYKQLLRSQKPKLHIVVYNGDFDMACNFLGDEWFVESLQQPVRERRDWYYTRGTDKQVAGFIKRYDGIDFVTVKGAGHMVPQDKPQQAFLLLKNFLLQ